MAATQKKKRRSLSVERLRSSSLSRAHQAKAKQKAAAPRGRSPTRAQIRVPFDKPAGCAAAKPPAPAPDQAGAKPAAPVAAGGARAGAGGRRGAARAGAGADQTARRRELGIVTTRPRVRHTPLALAPGRAAAATPPALGRRGPRRPCPRPRRYRTNRPARRDLRLVHGDRSATPLLQVAQLGFTLGLWKDGWIRVQRVAQTCPTSCAGAGRRSSARRSPCPFPATTSRGCYKLSAAPRPLG